MATIDSVKLPDNSTYDLTDNYSGYAKKVAGAITDDLASLTATGDLADSGKKISDLVLKSDVKDVLNSTSTTDPLSAKQGKVLADNLAANENVYGAKNFIPFPYENTNKTKNGITITDNNDGTVTLSGTAGSDVYVLLNETSLFTLDKGTYTLSGCPSGGGLSSYNLYLDGIAQSIDSGNGATFTLNNATTTQTCIFIKSGTAILTPITFSPMLRDARITDDTFVPYAPTNRELMSYKANGKVGAKNLLPYPFYETTKSENAVTFTDNGDGSVTVSGTASADTSFIFRNSDGILKKGTYIFSGCPSGGTISTYRMLIYENGNFISDFGNGTTFTIGSDVSDATIFISIKSGTAITTPITFKPMIRIAEDTDPTFAPYAMTNRELTKLADTISYTVSTSSVSAGFNTFDISSLGVGGHNAYVMCILLKNSGNYTSLSSCMLWDTLNKLFILSYIENNNLVLYVDSGITFPTGSTLTFKIRKFTLG